MNGGDEEQTGNKNTVKYYHRRKTDPGGDQEGEGKENSSNGDQQNDKSDKKSDSSDEKKGGEKKDKDEDESKQKMSPRKKWTLIIIAIIVGIILIAGAIAYWLHARHYETTDDAFIDGHVSQIAPQASGRVQSLLVDDNQKVEPGQLLAEIDPRDYQVRLAQAQAQREQAIAQVALQHANIDQSIANVHVAEADLFQADRDLKRFEAVNPKAITRQQLDNAIAAERSAQAKLDASQQAVEGARAQLGTAEANVRQAEVEVSNAELQLSYTKITSPIAGRVTRRTVEVGNVVSIGQPLLAIVSNDLWVTANYKETQLDYMRIGQPVQIEVDAFPDAIFHGHVDSFQKGSGSFFSTLPAENATGNYVKVVQRVPVKIVFDNPDERDKYPLAPGLSVDPRVTVR